MQADTVRVVSEMLAKRQIDMLITVLRSINEMSNKHVRRCEGGIGRLAFRCR